VIACDRVGVLVWRVGVPVRFRVGSGGSRPLIGVSRRVRASGGPLGGCPAGCHWVAGARCRAIGFRFTSAAAKLAWSVALLVPMYRLLRAP
jgi:hypothetical protein